MNHAIAAALLAILTVTAGSAASAGPTARFVGDDGYTAVDADEAWDSLNAALGSSSPDSVFLPAADLGPVPLAAHLLEASEPAVPRARYRLRYRTLWVEGSPGGPVPVSHVEVVRFNIGPAIHRDLAATHGDSPVADVQELGVGPHVAWRVVTRPVMGNRAMVVAAGRMELDDADAGGEACLGRPCLDPHPGIDSMVPWSALEPVAEGRLAGKQQRRATPAQVLELLLGEVDGLEEAEGAAASPGSGWTIEAVVESGLGQGAGLDGAYRWGDQMDDSVSAIWQRVVSFPSGGPESATLEAAAYECARGQGFAAPGAYCP